MKRTSRREPPCTAWPPASPPPTPSSCAPARGEAQRKPTAASTSAERRTRWKPSPERRSSSAPAPPSMASRTDAGSQRNITSTPPPEKAASSFRRNRRFWPREAPSSGWELSTGRTAACSSPNTARRARPSPETWTGGSTTSTGMTPWPPCTCSARSGNRPPASTT